MKQTFCLSLISLLVIVGVNGHGRLLDPPARSSMWRYSGYSNVGINYNDNELFCGGYSRQWDKNKGRCGICGDPWDAKEPRDHEDGGIYGRGIIARTYVEGQTIETEVEITAHHRGYFEFRICPLTRPGQVADQACLNENLLQLADGSGSKYKLGPTRTGSYYVRLVLPEGLTCSRCVFQWHYYTGNKWGVCDDGVEGLGCGPQEVFRGCADVAIIPSKKNETVAVTTPITTENHSEDIYHKKSIEKPEPNHMQTSQALPIDEVGYKIILTPLGPVERREKSLKTPREFKAMVYTNGKDEK